MKSELGSRVLHILIAAGLLYVGILQNRLGAVIPIVVILIGLQIYFIIRARRNSSREERFRRTESVLRQAEELEKTDPAAAHRMLEQHFSAEQQEKDRELAELRAKAPFDTASAKELQRRLREDARDERRGKRLVALMAIVQRAPIWLRPSIYGAAILFFIMGARILFAIPWLVRRPADIPQLCLALIVVTAAGGAGGLGYGLIGRHLRPIPGVGPYIAGVLAVAGYMAALLVAIPLIDPSEHLIADGTDTIVFVVVTAFSGLLFGHAALRE